MRHSLNSLAGLLACTMAISTVCYHAVVETGLAPSPVKIDKGWAHGFLFGLVPPVVTETSRKCVNGIARVETQQTFLNMVAYGITYGIYSPMSVKVTCAQAPTGPARDAGASAERTATP